MAKRNESDAWASAIPEVVGESLTTVPVAQRAGLRLLVYDQRSLWRGLRPDLTPIWALGSVLYRVLRRIDHVRGVSSWAEALDWIGKVKPGRPIEEVQFWGHGLWGLAKIGDDRLDDVALSVGHEHAARLAAIRRRMLPDGNALWWFRTCLTLGARPGQLFSAALADTLGCRVAGHTYVIGAWQSGLHTVQPGCCATWCEREGWDAGTPNEPTQGVWSTRREPNTITFLHGKVPAGY